MPSTSPDSPLPTHTKRPPDRKAEGSIVPAPDGSVGHR